MIGPVAGAAPAQVELLQLRQRKVPPHCMRHVQQLQEKALCCFLLKCTSMDCRLHRPRTASAPPSAVAGTSVSMLCIIYALQVAQTPARHPPPLAQQQVTQSQVRDKRVASPAFPFHCHFLAPEYVFVPSNLSFQPVPNTAHAQAYGHTLCAVQFVRTTLQAPAHERHMLQAASHACQRRRQGVRFHPRGS